MPDLPRVTVSAKTPALPCCGASVDDQTYCSTMHLVHLLRCECGAVWECIDQTIDGPTFTFEAREQAECRGTYMGRRWWKKEPTHA